MLHNNSLLGVENLEFTERYVCTLLLLLLLLLFINGQLILQ